MKRALLVAGFFLTVAGSMPSARAQDAEEGKKIFKSICNLCHEAVEGKNRVGPSLYGVYGRTSGTAPGFAYSDGVKAIHLVWNDQTLDRWINSPQATVPGTKMTYTGLKDDKKRHDVIAFLKTLHH